MIVYFYKCCGIVMPDSSDSYIDPVGQVDFPGKLVLEQVNKNKA
jgi:hypothetical protein